MFYHENVLPESVAVQLYEYLLTSPWTWGYRSHKSQMRRSIPKWSIFFGGPTKEKQPCYDCEHELNGVILDVWKYTKPYLDPEDVLVRCYANAQTCGQDQRLHTDDSLDTSKTIILYVNKSWNADWGGETIIWDSEKRLITDSVLPKFKSMLGFPGNVWHGVRSVSQYSDSLRMTLMFKTRNIKDVL
jgi:SM-20-related protein|tara:strand:+ start:3162 stop:3722 length:561 start_codon:yes stop_codon:yes gene_type:complete